MQLVLDVLLDIGSASLDMRPGYN